MLIIATPLKLRFGRSSLTIEEVNAFDLLLPREHIEQAAFILYTDGTTVKVLKYRFPVEPWMEEAALNYYKDRHHVRLDLEDAQRTP